MSAGVAVAVWALFAGWMAAGYLTLWRPGPPARKRRFYPVWVVVVAGLFLTFIGSIEEGLPPAWIILLVGGVTILRLRLTWFCGRCGQFVVPRSRRPAVTCPQCGARR